MAFDSAQVIRVDPSLCGPTFVPAFFHKASCAVTL